MKENLHENMKNTEENEKSIFFLDLYSGKNHAPPSFMH
jgi:hypothetical protein